LSYVTTITNVGLAKISAALAGSSQITMSQIAVGDGNGAATNPLPSNTALVREVYRGSVNQLSFNANGQLVAELVVPVAVGGFTVREIGLYDSGGDLFAIGSLPAITKPITADNAAGELVLRIVVAVQHAQTINLTIDASTVIATQQWVENNFSAAAMIPGGTVNQVLAKKSNIDGDTEWRDPTAVNVVVDAREQEVTLTATQTVVTLTTVTTTGLVLYVDGIRLPKSRWTATNATTVTLDRTYPVGTILTLVQNAPAATIEAIKVGQVIMLGLTSTPNEVFGYGTWQRVAEGRAIFGLSSTDADFNTLAKTGGSKTHSHGGNTNTAGAHGHQGVTDWGGNHNHGGATGAGGAHGHQTTNSGTHSHGGSTAAHTLTIEQTPAHSHTTQVAVNTGGGSGSIGLDKNQLFNGVVQLDSNTVGGGQAHAHGISPDGDHSHSVTTAPDHAHSIANSGQHAHGIVTDGNHSHTITASTESNLPPYYTVAMWQRTA